MAKGKSRAAGQTGRPATERTAAPPPPPRTRRRPEPRCPLPIPELSAHVAALGQRYLEVQSALAREARQGRVARLLGQSKAQEQFRAFERALREHGDVLCDAALALAPAPRAASASAFAAGALSSELDASAAAAAGAEAGRPGIGQPLRSISEVAVADLVKEGGSSRPAAAAPAPGQAPMPHAASAPPADLLDLLIDVPAAPAAAAAAPPPPVLLGGGAAPEAAPAPVVSSNPFLEAPSSNPFASFRRWDSVGAVGGAPSPAAVPPPPQSQPLPWGAAAPAAQQQQQPWGVAAPPPPPPRQVAYAPAPPHQQQQQQVVGDLISF